MNFLTTLFTKGRNLDDWFSPILIKELRQGMRARVFVLSFLLMQVFLVTLVLGNVAAQNDRATLDSQNYFFWTIVGFALLGLMPLRGLVAVSLEVKNHTLETIMLTRLTAWRVVFGKWSALFAQSVLLVTAVLPYVILRYFIGGDDVVTDFETILFMLWLSGILIATSIAVSALGNAVVRIILLLVGVWTIGAGGAGIFDSGGTRGGPLEIIGWLLIFGFFIPALLFELTASGIAPASENHAIRRRALAVIFALVACTWAGCTKNEFKPGVVLPLIALIGTCFFELSEKPRLLSRMVQALARWGVLGRIAAVFLLPGWPSALLFSLVVIPTAMSVLFNFAPPDSDMGWLLPIFATLGSVLLPILVCHFFWPKMKQVLLIVVLYNIILMGLASVLQGFASMTHTHFDEFLAFLPSLPVLIIGSSYGAFKDSSILYTVGNGITLSLLVLILLIASRKYFSDLFALFRSAAISHPPDKLKSEKAAS